MTAFSTAQATASITVAEVNDAPELDNSGFMSLPTLSEDVASNTGGDPITDVDAGAVEGIAISFASSVFGTWQYNTGTGWLEVGEVSATNALLLRSTDSLRFQPDGTNAVTATMLFQAWDQSSGMAGTKVDSSLSGGTTAFSTHVEVAIISVTAINDAPTLVNSATHLMEDMAGAISTATLTITIQGQNDSPLAVYDSTVATEAGGVSNGSAGVNPSGNVLTNDTDADAGDTRTVAGVRAGTAAIAVGSVGTSVSGLYGSIQINLDGSYRYEVDNSNNSVQALRTSGQTLQDVFTYTVTDLAGATSSTQITVTIQGANDAPVVASDTAIATEAGGIANGSAGTNPAGNVLANDFDVDAGDSMNVSGVVAGTNSSASGNVGAAVAGAYGSIQINSNGSFNYIVDNNNATVQALRLTADTITDVFSYSVQDAAGATSTTQITITIRGANDAPVSFSDNGNAHEAGGTVNGTPGSNATGNVISNDVELDSGDTTTVSGVQAGIQSSTSGGVGTSVAGSFGTIVIDTSGAYTYSIDQNNAAVQALRLSTQTLTDVFSYTIVDAAGLSSTARVTITLHGANDAPVAVADNGIAIEAGGLANALAGSIAVGNVLSNDTDVDAGDTRTVAGVMMGSSGSPDSDVGASVLGLYGSISIDSTGNYTYTVNNENHSVQALRNSSQTLQDVFTYKIVDAGGLESLTQVTITIQGANDTPTAVADNTAIAVEAGGVNNETAGSHGNGNVLDNDTDIDFGDNLLVAGVIAGTSGDPASNVGATVSGSFGQIIIESNGSYTYVIDNENTSVQALRNSSQTLQDIFTYRIVDAAGLESIAQVTITIQGANDSPTAIADNTAIAVEAGGVANGIAGTVGTGNVLANDTDVDSQDNGETKSVSGVGAGIQSSTTGNVALAVTGAYGSITIAADGSYTYTIDNSNASVQALRTSSQTLTDLFTYTMIDAGGLTSTAQVTVTIQGSNDAPIGINDTANAIEASGVSNGTAGSNASGNVLANDTDVDSVANGETKSVDGVVAGSQSSAIGNVGTTLAGMFGAITINVDGSFVYIIDNNNSTVQGLRTISDSITDLFSYRIVDAGGLSSLAILTITITGQNDAPVASNDSAIAIESGGLANGAAGSSSTGNVLANDTDVDSVANGETKSVSGVIAGAHAFATGNVGSSVMGSFGSITLAVNGTYTYIVDETNAAVQALRTSSHNLSDLFTYTMTDAAGATSTATITIIIQGSNDTPTAVADNGVALEAGGLSNGAIGSDATGNVLSNDTDVDSITNGETKTVSGVAAGSLASATGSVGSLVTGSFGSITINSDGSYSYVVDNNSLAVQALRTNGQTLSDIFTYTMIDAAGLSSTTQLTITIHGANDSPFLTPIALHTDSITPINLLAPGLFALATDPENDILTIQLVSSPSSGTIVVRPDGSLTYVPDIQFSGTTHFIVEVSDGNSTSQATFTITVSDTLAPQPPPPPNNNGPGTGSGGTNNDDPVAGVGLNQVGSVVIATGLTTSSVTSAEPGILRPDAVPANPNVNNSVVTSPSVAAEALELLTTNRFLIIDQNYLLNDEREPIGRQVVLPSQDRLITSPVFNQEQPEVAQPAFNVIPESIVMTAVGTGIAIWVMYDGQVAVTLLSSSATWLQVDPLVVVRGDATEDDADLSAEEKIFDSTLIVDNQRNGTGTN